MCRHTTPPSFYGAIGETDEAFVWLNRAFEERSSWIAFMAVDRVVLTGKIDRDVMTFGRWLDNAVETTNTW